MAFRQDQILPPLQRQPHRYEIQITEWVGKGSTQILPRSEEHSRAILRMHNGALTYFLVCHTAALQIECKVASEPNLLPVDPKY